MPDSIILADTGYKVNFLQFGLVRKLAISLTTSNLKIEDVVNDEVLLDVPLAQVKSIKASNIIFAVFLSYQGANLKIKTDKQTFKISWKDVDARKVLFGEAGYEYNALSGYKKARLWQETFNKIKSGQTVQPIYNNIQKLDLNQKAQNQRTTKKPKYAYVLIFIPILMLIVGTALAYMAVSHPNQVQKYSPYFAAGALLDLVGLGLLPFGLIFGLRKLR